MQTACIGMTASITAGAKQHENKGELIDGFAFFIFAAGLIAQKESPREAG
ncbi:MULTISPECIES: hypothetical protein [Paraburkholderia]